MVKKRRYVYKSVYAGAGYSKSRKKNKKTIKFFLCFLLLCVFIFCGYFGGKKLLDIAGRSDKTVVKNIDIVGTKNVTKAEIKELLPFKIGDNLLKINLSEAEEKIKELKPELKNIVIKRRWQKVKVRLYERTPEAFIVCNGERFGIDFDNLPFPLRGFMNTMNVPKIVYQSDDERRKMLSFIKRFKHICGEFLDNISEMKFSSTGDLIFVMNSNTVIFWGDEMPERLSHKFKKFQKIYVDAMAKYKQIEYIDMTLYCSGKATMKPYYKVEKL